MTLWAYLMSVIMNLQSEEDGKQKLNMIEISFSRTFKEIDGEESIKGIKNCRRVIIMINFTI